MSGRDGRDFRERSRSTRHSISSSSRMRNPESRHLWVGNLGSHIAKSMLEEHFCRFGELDNISLPPGRSYAFVNFVREEDAVAAAKSLQGFSVDGGMPLKIEFAKSDKSSASRDDNYSQQRGEIQHSNRRSAFSSRESTMRDTSPDGYMHEKLRSTVDDEDHPSEMLWIGFPSFLKVEERILRRAFSPFGEIDKITAFPGRTYAFVQFMNIASAVRAKDTLQGKLFGNPRVHIRFARNEHSSSGGGRRGQTIPSSPLGLPGSSNTYKPDRNFGDTSKYADHGATGYHRDEPLWGRTKHAYDDERGFNELGHGQGLPYHRSPGQEFSPQKLPRQSAYQADPWDLPEDPYVFHETQKTKTGSFLHDQELPEYPLDLAEQGKTALKKMFPDHLRSDESWATLPYGRHPEHPMIPNAQLTDRLDSLKPSHDTFQSPLSPVSPNSVEWKRNMFELPRLGAKEVWKWEGTIAKGGTPVCRARCFPVGKVMDIILPEFLDCTARTGLDMLAKHYYQAKNHWVVFFVAATDADMSSYNDFMHYLGDKQRAAVAKLDERNTLFLVPPSAFSENVLKIPGKLSISGVVLSLEPWMPSLPPATGTLEALGRSYAPLPPGPPPIPIMATNSSVPPSYVPASESVSEYAPHMPPAQSNRFPAYGGDHHQAGNNSSSLHESKYQFPDEEFRASEANLNQSGAPPGYAVQFPSHISATSASQLPSRNTTASPLPLHGTTASQLQQDDSEGDPQKRLQATLQLAAALLQQMQQGKGTT